MNVPASTAFTFYADLGASGLEGTAGVTVYLDDDVVTARTMVGIEQLGTSTVYSVQLISPLANGEYLANVDNDGVGTNVVWFEPFTVTSAAPEAVAPSAAFVFYADLGATGLEGVAGVTVYLDDDVVTAQTTSGIEQLAASTVYSVEITTEAVDGYYAALVDDDGTNVAWFEPFQVSSDPAVTGDAYATVGELARILKIRTPSTEQTDAMERCLLAAAGEINAEIDLAADAAALAGWQIALAAQVNLERAAELWQQQEIAFGIVGLGSEFGATHIARNTWDKHAYTLAPLKGQFGLA